MRQWAENAAAAGYSVHVGGFDTPTAPRLEFGDVAESVHIGPDARPPFTTAVWVPWLWRLARRLRPTVVHAHQPPIWGLHAALAGVRPLVVSAWGSDVYRAGREARLMSWPAFKRADRVLAPSQHLLDTMVARGADPSRCREVDLGVDLTAFSPARGGDDLRDELELGDGPLVLSFRGALPVYNLPVVLDAFDRLRARRPTAQLLVATGSAAPPPEVRAALERPDLEGAVRVVGDVPHDQMPRYYQAADVGVSIASSDGGPRSVWEALACELPVVLSDLPQLRRRLGEEAGARFVPIESEAVGSALEELIAEPELRGTMGRAGRAWAEAHVGRPEHVERLARAYAEARERAT